MSTGVKTDVDSFIVYDSNYAPFRLGYREEGLGGVQVHREAPTS